MTNTGSCLMVVYSQPLNAKNPVTNSSHSLTSCLKVCVQGFTDYVAQTQIDILPKEYFKNQTTDT